MYPVLGNGNYMWLVCLSRRKGQEGCCCGRTSGEGGRIDHWKSQPVGTSWDRTHSRYQIAQNDFLGMGQLQTENDDNWMERRRWSGTLYTLGSTSESSISFYGHSRRNLLMFVGVCCPMHHQSVTV